MPRLHFQNSRKLNLAANLYPSDSDAIVIMAHGFTYESGKFDYIAQCLNAAQYNVLTFDFSGCGASDNDTLNCAKEIDDLQSAIAFAQRLGSKRIALWGHSLGSRICLQSYCPEISTMVLTGALLGPVNYVWQDYFSEEQMIELEQKGRITQPIDRGLRESVIIESQMLKDFAEFDQKIWLRRIACPVLIINGDGDAEECMLKEIADKAMRFFPASSRHKIIKGAPHNFLRHLDDVINLGLPWLMEHLPAK